MPYRRQYGIGTGADIYRSITKATFTDFAVAADWTPVAGDVKVSKDGAAAANIATLPTYITSCGWKYVFADAELQCKVLKVLTTDSATKAVEDDGFEIETENHQSALFTNGVIRQSILQVAAAGSVTLDASASATDNEYNGMVLVVVQGTTGIGQVARIKSYAGGTKIATLYENWPLTPTGTVVVNIYGDAGIGVALDIPAIPSAPPVLGTDGITKLVGWLALRAGLGKKTFNRSTKVENQRNPADSVTVGTATHADDGTTTTLNKLA